MQAPYILNASYVPAPFSIFLNIHWLDMFLKLSCSFSHGILANGCNLMWGSWSVFSVLFEDYEKGSYFESNFKTYSKALAPALFVLLAFI